jgi:hypothetical protein
MQNVELKTLNFRYSDQIRLNNHRNCRGARPCLGINLTVKPLTRKELKFLANSITHLKMTELKSKKLVHFNALELLALKLLAPKFISGSAFTSPVTYFWRLLTPVKALRPIILLYSPFQMSEPQCRGLVTKPLPRFCGLSI